MVAIDSVQMLDVALFNSTYLNRKPVLVKGGVKHLKAFEMWTPEYLLQKIGDREVTVNHSVTGEYDYAVDGQIKKIEMPLSKLIAYIVSDEKDKNSYYLQHSSIKKNFPKLHKDLEEPSIIKKTDNLEHVNLWLGGKGCLTQLHYDRNQNFLMQFRGVKEITFFSSSDTPYLYPIEGEGQITSISEIKLADVNYDKFPLFKKAKPFFAKLEPGDMIYMPPGWWHQVKTVQWSISVNYWWNRFDILEGTHLEILTVEDIRKLIELFQSRGLSLNHKDGRGELLFFKAIRLGYSNVVEAFLSLGVDPNSHSAINQSESALSIAVRSGEIEILKLLLIYGAEDRKIDTKIKTLLKKHGYLSTEQLMKSKPRSI